MRKPFNGSFPLTQGFGNKLIINGVDIYAQYNLQGHNGHDYATPTGTEIIAPHKGKVLEVADEGNIGYGKYIKIESETEGSVLAHLKSFKVKVGDTVEEGQTVALSNNTGNSTGPHLHWGYYRIPRNRQNGFAGFIDPSLYISSPSQTVTVDGEQMKQLQKELDELRTARDNNWNLYQGQLEIVKQKDQRISELESQVNEYKTKYETEQKENITLNKSLEEITGSNKDYAVQLLEAQQRADSCNFEVKATNKLLDLSEEAHLSDREKRVSELKKPVEEVVKPVQKERDELFELLFEKGLGVYKKFRKEKGVWKTVIDFLKSVLRLK